MIRSMTGFGRATATRDQRVYAVEARSVNSRYFKAAVRVPDPLGPLEPELEARLREWLSRGSVTLNVKVVDDSAEAAGSINEAALASYLASLDRVRARAEGDPPRVELTGLLSLPGVVQPRSDEEARIEAARPVLEELTHRACADLVAMRKAEGERIKADLEAQAAEIRAALETVGAAAPEAVAAHERRLRERISGILSDAGDAAATAPDVAKEVAVFADRADVNEELRRLEGHLEQFERVLETAEDDAAGRTLEFIGQEMLREANTVASKLGHGTVSDAVVRMKRAIDRIKEQAQNAE